MAVSLSFHKFATNAVMYGALIDHALGQMTTSLGLVGAKDIFQQKNDMNHLGGTARMGFDAETSVVDRDCRFWDIPNLWICDGSVFPTVGGVNPSLTITAIGMRTAARIGAMAKRGELSSAASRLVRA